MDRKTITDKISRKLNADKSAISSLFDSLSEVMAERCSELDYIAVPGFGTFEPKKKNERIAVHPATGRRLLVPPKIVLSFKPSSLLKQKVNGERSDA